MGIGEKRKRESGNNRAGNRRGLAAGHESRAEAGQPEAFDLQATVPVRALRLAGTYEVSVAAWGARRGQLPENLQR
eukprot:COSAG03_NODE_14005_length_480_cov_0.947507_1_plen_75_part_10